MSLQSQPQPPSPNSPPDKTKVAIPDLTAETLMPIKGVKLSAFARMVWGIGLVIVLSIGWLVYSKFDIDRLRGADHFIDKARHAVDAKDWPAALSAIQKVPPEARNEPGFLRVIADYLIITKTEPDFLSQTLERLQATSYKKADDDLWLAWCYLATDRTLAAREMYEKVPLAARQTVAGMDIEVALLRAEGRMREAAELEGRLFATYANDPRISVRRSARDLKGTFPEIREAARERLERLAERTDEHGLAAIRVLMQDSPVTSLEARRLQQLSEAHPDITSTDRLMLASIFLRVNPEDRDIILRREIERMKDSGAASLQQLVEWLAKEKAFPEIVRIVPRESLLRSVELFPAVAQDLAQREQWDELMKLIEKSEKNPLPVSNALAANWRALATYNLHPGDSRAVRAHLEEAIAEGLAKDDGHALLAAMTLAEKWNMLDLALETTLRLATPDSPNESSLLDKCWTLAFRVKNADILIDVAKRQSRLRPGNVLLTRRLDYLRLLRGEAIELASEYKTSINSSISLEDTTLLLSALKSYRFGDLQKATDYMGKIQHASGFSAGESAVYAGLLAKICGKTARAFELAERIQPGLLLSEEQVFLKMAL